LIPDAPRLELLDKPADLQIVIADRGVVDRAQPLDVVRRWNDAAAHRARLEAEVLRGAELLERAVVRTGRVDVDPWLARDPRAMRVDRAHDQERRFVAMLVEPRERRIDDGLAEDDAVDDALLAHHVAELAKAARVATVGVHESVAGHGRREQARRGELLA